MKTVVAGTVTDVCWINSALVGCRATRSAVLELRGHDRVFMEAGVLCLAQTMVECSPHAAAILHRCTFLLQLVHEPQVNHNGDAMFCVLGSMHGLCWGALVPTFQ